MSLNIRSEKTLRLARELARLTGDSMTAAVDKAIQEPLERVRNTKNGELAERLLKIGRECAPLWNEPYRSMDHGDLLYDEKGLAKRCEADRSTLVALTRLPRSGTLPSSFYPRSKS
ncbi:MAG: type II toxin-antitoxin system VapB family antitoxin, partial [Candidatus Sulfotelmatobacter sp.]